MWKELMDEENIVQISNLKLKLKLKLKLNLKGEKEVKINKKEKKRKRGQRQGKFRKEFSLKFKIIMKAKKLKRDVGSIIG